MEVEKNQPITDRHSFTSFNFWSGFLFGIGLIAFIDEVVFHQLLHWHHFYDRATTSIGLIADGIFHAVSWFATVIALFMYAHLKRNNRFMFVLWLGAVLFGAGLFQLYDGMVQHKWMRIHQIRYGVDLLPYDLTWNLVAIILLIVGVMLIRRGKQTSIINGSMDNA